MQITPGSDARGCIIKAKTTTVSLDGAFKIGDLVLPGPGEYEAGGIFAEIQPDLANFHIEDMVILYLGHTKRSVTEAELANVENVDILLVVVDNEGKDEMTAITKLSKEIEPRVIVLVGIDDPAVFTKVDGEVPEVVPSLKLAKSDLPEESRKVYVLKV